MSNDCLPVPGPGSLIPHLVCGGCADAIEFYKKAFDAVETFRMASPDGQRIMHAQIQIDGSSLFLADDFPEYCGGKSGSPKGLGGTPVTIHRYVANCDAAIEKAVQAGATVLMPASDAFWGDRYGSVTDPFGHNWSFATHQKDMTTEELKSAMDAAFAQQA